MLTSISSFLIYLAVAALLWMRMLGKGPAKNWPKSWLILVGLLATSLHGIFLNHHWFTSQGIDIGFFSVLSLVGWLAALLLLLAALSRPIESLGIIVLPFAALTILLRITTDQHNYLAGELAPGLEIHILISILAYSLLAIAAVQAILLYVQDANLHNQHPGGFVRTFPALDTMESLLFNMLALGFVVLSISLVSGSVYLEDMFAQHLVHKTLLSILAWLIFGTLLVGRWQFGWRGKTAIRWTISGFLVLMLAYFGSKFVIELVLNR